MLGFGKAIAVDTEVLIGADAYNFDSYSVMSGEDLLPVTESIAECGCGHALVVVGLTAEK